MVWHNPTQKPIISKQIGLIDKWDPNKYYISFLIVGCILIAAVAVHLNVKS